MAQATKKKAPLVPKLRFKEFIGDGEWEAKKIRSILTIGNGRDYKHLKKGNFPVYGTGGYMLSVDGYLHDGTSVCIGRKGTIDKPFILNGKFWTVDTLFYTHSYKKTAPNFVYILFQNINWQNYNAASGVPSLSKDTIYEISIPMPREPEQQRIADCLTSLDENITAESQKLEALSAHKKALMQKLFPADGEKMPVLRFKEFAGDGVWEEQCIEKKFSITRGYVLAIPKLSQSKTEEMPYPVYSSQTKNNGLCGYYSDYLYENAITWTTDGANAGDVNFRMGKFYCTNVCGVLISDAGYANQCIAAQINAVSKQYVSYVGNPKLMNGVMAKIAIPIASVQEQQRIADCLTSLDEYITAQGRKIALLKEHKKGLMQQLFPCIKEENI